MKKPVMCLLGLFAAITASAVGPQLVFETADGAVHVEKIADLGRAVFTPEGLDVTDRLGADLGSYPYSSLRRVSFDANGEVTGIDAPAIAVTSSLRVTPSPAIDFITVKGCADGASFGIYASDGRRVAYVTDYDGSPLDISPLPAGIYIVKYNSSSAKFFKK